MTQRAVPAGTSVPGRSYHAGLVRRRVEARQRAAPGPPGWGLGSGLITRSRKTFILQKRKLVMPLYPTVGKQSYNTSTPGRSSARSKE